MTVTLPAALPRAATLVAAGLVAAHLPTGLAAQTSRGPDQPARRAPADARALSDALAVVAERVQPAVVEVLGPTTPAAPVARAATVRHGSGFLLDTLGHVVTSAHVVQGAAEVRLLVPLPMPVRVADDARSAPGEAGRVGAPAAMGRGDGAPAPRLRVTARVLGSDAESDVALLRLAPADAERWRAAWREARQRDGEQRDAGRRSGGEVPRSTTRRTLAASTSPAPHAPTLPLAHAHAPRVGQIVLAVGSPRGLANSVSLGVVSASARALEPDAPVAYVQTDAPINPGSSGGPLVDADGHVVGLSKAILTRSGGSEGLGFAVPAPVVHAVVAELGRHGRVRRGALGIDVQEVGRALAVGLALDPAGGLLVADVEGDGPADRSGVRVGDQILRVDGRAVHAPWQLATALLARGAGDSATLAISRDTPTGRVVAEVRVPLADRDGALAGPPPVPQEVAELGLVAVDVAPPHALVRPVAHVHPAHAVRATHAAGPDGAAADATPNRAGDPAADAPTSGVLVLRSEPRDASADDGGFLAGDLIVWLGGQRVTSVDALRDAVRAVPAAMPVVAQVLRRGALRFVAIERD